MVCGCRYCGFQTLDGVSEEVDFEWGVDAGSTEVLDDVFGANFRVGFDISGVCLIYSGLAAWGLIVFSPVTCGARSVLTTFVIAVTVRAGHNFLFWTSFLFSPIRLAIKMEPMVLSSFFFCG